MKDFRGGRLYSCRHIRADKRAERTDQRHYQRNDNRVREVFKSVFAAHYIRKLAKREGLVDGVVFRKCDGDKGKYRKKHSGDYDAKNDAGNYPFCFRLISTERLYRRISDSVLSGKKVEKKCYGGGEEKYQPENAALGVIHSVYCLLIHEHGERFIHSANHKRHAVIRYNSSEYREDDAYHRFFEIRKSYSEKAVFLRYSEGFRRFVRGAVLVAENVRYHKIGYRKGIHHRAENYAPETINAAFQPEKIFNYAVVAEENYKPRSVRN